MSHLSRINFIARFLSTKMLEKIRNIQIPKWIIVGNHGSDNDVFFNNNPVTFVNHGSIVQKYNISTHWTQLIQISECCQINF